MDDRVIILIDGVWEVEMLDGKLVLREADSGMGIILQGGSNFVNISWDEGLERPAGIIYYRQRTLYM